MGAYALGASASRFITPGTGLLGAGLLALVLLLPSQAEARFLNRSLAVSAECHSRVPDHLSFRAAGPCKRQPAERAEYHPHHIFSGKFSAALAIELYCRTTSVDVSQLTRRNTANIPHPVPQRVIPTRAPEPDRRPRCNLAAGPDRDLVEASLRLRLPDG